MSDTRRIVVLALSILPASSLAQDRGRVAKPFGFALTDPDVRLSRIRLFPKANHVRHAAGPRIE